MSGTKFNIQVLEMKRVEDLLDRGEYVDAELLETALQENVDKQVPHKVLDYLCRFLRGEVKKPRGRKPEDEVVKRQRAMFMRYFYRMFLNNLRENKDPFQALPEGWEWMKLADPGKGPPHERAAKIVAEAFLDGARSWRSVHNIVSSSK